LCNTTVEIPDNLKWQRVDCCHLPAWGLLLRHTYVWSRVKQDLHALVAHLFKRSSATVHYSQPLHSVQFVLQRIEDGILQKLVLILLITTDTTSKVSSTCAVPAVVANCEDYQPWPNRQQQTLQCFLSIIQNQQFYA